MNLNIWVWLGVAVVLAIIEGMTVGLVCIWFAVGALAALVCAILGAGLAVQLAVFAAVSALALALTRPLVCWCW
jgi:membrane protein implicated in regulation of membrane protease activity